MIRTGKSIWIGYHSRHHGGADNGTVGLVAQWEVLKTAIRSRRPPEGSGAFPSCAVFLGTDRRLVREQLKPLVEAEGCVFVASNMGTHVPGRTAADGVFAGWTAMRDLELLSWADALIMDPSSTMSLFYAEYVAYKKRGVQSMFYCNRGHVVTQQNPKCLSLQPGSILRGESLSSLNNVNRSSDEKQSKQEGRQPFRC